MEDIKVGVLKVTFPTDKPFNFNDIENNEAAKRYLLEHQGVPPEKLFEQVYQIQQEYAAEMMKRRDMRKSATEEEGQVYDSALDTKDREQNYYDNKAKDATAGALSWLQRLKDSSPPRQR